MSLTNFPNGTTSFGIPQFGGGIFSVRSAIASTEFFFIDGVGGNDANDGKSPENAFKTIQKGVDSCSHDKGSYVLVGEGTYTEQVTITKRGIHLIGMGAYRTNIVPASSMTVYDAVQSIVCVRPTAIQGGYTQGVEIAGIRVSGAGGYTGIYVGDGADTANASATHIHDCIIDGSNREGLYGIVIRGGSFIKITNNIIASWTRAGVVITSGLVRTAYYNVVDSNWIISGGTCGVALGGAANSNIISNNVFCDDATTGFTSCIQVAALTGYSTCTGTDNVAANNHFGSGGTNGSLLASGDHNVVNHGRTAGNDAAAYEIVTATWGSL